jgi:hypothetical protein
MSMGNHGGMILTGENRRTRRKTCLSATLSTTNPTWNDPRANPDLRAHTVLMSGYASIRTDTKNQTDNCVCLESRSEAARTRSFLPCCHGPHQIHPTTTRSDQKTDRYLKTQLPSKGTNNIHLSTMYSP